MASNVETDDQCEQLDRGSSHLDQTTDTGVGASLYSCSSDLKAVIEPDASGFASCGSNLRAAPTETDAIPCTCDLREGEPSAMRNEGQLSDDIASKSRVPLQPPLSTEAPNLSSLSRRKCRLEPVEHAEASTTVSSTTVPSSRADQSLSQREPPPNQWKPEYVEEEPEFFDIAMIYCQEDEELAKKFCCVLQKFIILDGQQKPRIYMDLLDLRDAFGGSEIEHFNHVLECSSYAFVVFSQQSVDTKDLKGKSDRISALHGSITDERCAKVVPIVTGSNLRLGSYFDSLTKINLKLLLLGDRILDLVAVEDLKKEHIDNRLLNRISNHLNGARARRQCKMTNCKVSNSGQSTDAQRPVTQTVNHTELIRAHYDVLVDAMDVEYGLLTILFSKDVLSHEEMDSIAAEKTRHQKNEKLLSLLYLKDAKSFEKFVCGLSESNQDHLVERLHGPRQK